MKKLYSLIRACMTSDMALFKIKTKKKNKSALLIPLVIGLYLMFTIWSSANAIFEKLYPLQLSHILLSLFVFSISFMTLIEGIYKSGSLIFNCKDDQLLLSLPISRRTVLFIRIFKFYVFELIFNSLFLLPIMIAYIRWNDNLSWTYFLTSFIMLIMLPIIPIVLSCIIGAITSSLSSRFKYKNVVQIILSMIILVGIFAVSFNMDGAFNYVVEHATSLNDLITKIYYPAGSYASLITEFKVWDLIVFIVIHLGIFSLGILVLGKYYFKINSRLKKVETTTNKKKSRIENLTIKTKSPLQAIIAKEIKTFFKTPVFIINAGFALVLFMIATIGIAFKYNSFIDLFASDENAFGLAKETIINNLSILILMIILVTSYMTSITSSVISLEGRNIRILKSLPIKVKTILMGKVLAPLLITTPVLLIGDIILFMVMKIGIIEALLLIVLSILIPSVSHFIGIIVNLQYPKLEWENTAEVVKQSASSFISVMIGIVLMIITLVIVSSTIGHIKPLIILIIMFLLHAIINAILYLYLTKNGVKSFNKLSI